MYGYSSISKTRLQWAPSLTSHDPNPPLTLESPSANNYSQSIDGAITPAAAVLKSTSTVRVGSTSPAAVLLGKCNKVLVGVLDSTASLIRRISTSYTGVLTSSGSILKSTIRSLVGSITPVASLSSIKVAFAILTGAITPVATILKGISTSYTGVLTSSGSILKSTIRSIIGVLTSSGSILKSTIRSLVGGITPGSVLSSIKVAFATLTGSITPGSTLLRSLNKTLTSTLSYMGDIIPTMIGTISKSIAGSLSISGTVVKRSTRIFIGVLLLNSIGVIRGFNLQGAISLSSSFIANKTYLLFGSLSTSGSIVKSVRKFLIGILNLGAIGAIRGLILQGSFGISAAISTSFSVGNRFLSLASQLSFTGIRVTRTSKLLSSVLSFVHNFSTGSLRLSKLLSGILSYIGLTSKNVSSNKSGVLSTSGVSVRLYNNLAISLTGSINPAKVISLKKVLYKALVASISSSGSLSRLIYKANAVGFLTPRAQGILRGTNAQGAISSGSTLSSFYVSITGLFKSITGVVSSSGVIVRKANKVFSGVLGLGSPGRLVDRFNVALISFIGLLTSKKVRPISLLGSVSSSGSILKSFVKLFIGSISSSGTINRFPKKVMVGTFTFFGQVIRGGTNFLSLVGTVSYSGLVVLKVGLTRFISISGSLGFIGTIAKTWTYKLLGIVSANGSIIRRTVATKFSSLGFSGINNRNYLGMIMVVSGVVSLTSTTLLTTVKSLTSSIGFTSSTLSSKVKVAILTGVLGFVGTISSLKFKIVLLIGSLPIITGVLRKKVNLSVTKLVGVLGLGAPNAIRGLNLQGAIGLASITQVMKVIPRAISSSISFIGSLSRIKYLGKLLSGTLNLGSPGRLVDRFTVGVMTFVGILIPLKVKLRSNIGVLSYSSGIVRFRITKLLLGVINTSSTVVKSIGKKVIGGVLFVIGDLLVPLAGLYSLALDGVINISSTLTKRTNKLVGSVLSFIGVITKSIRKVILINNLSFTGIVNEIEVRLISLISSIGFNGSILRLISSKLSSVLSTVGTLFNRRPIYLTGTLTTNATTQYIKTYIKLISGVIVPLGVVSVKKVLKFFLVASITTSGTVTKLIRINKSGVLSLVKGFIAAKDYIIVNLLGVISASGTIRKIVFVELISVLSTVGSIIKLVPKYILNAFDLVADIVAQRVVLKTDLSGSLSTSGVIVKSIGKILFGVQNLSGLISRVIQKVLLSGLSFIGLANKLVSTYVTSVLSFIGLDVPLFISLSKSSTAFFAFFKYNNPTVTGLRSEAPTINNIRYNTSTIVNLTWS